MITYWYSNNQFSRFVIPIGKYKYLLVLDFYRHGQNFEPLKQINKTEFFFIMITNEQSQQ